MAKWPFGKNADNPVLPEQNRRIERRWLWIALLSLSNLVFTAGGTIEFFNLAAETYDYYHLISGSGFILMAVGVFLAPVLFNRLGILDNPGRYRLTFCILAVAGIAVFAAYIVIFGNEHDTDSLWPALFLQYVIMLVPAAVTGMALHRAVQVIRSKSTVNLSAYSIVAVDVVTIAVVIGVDAAGSSYNASATSVITVYAALLIIPLILLLTNKSSLEYTAPKNAAYFSESLFPKFMILAFIMLFMDSFSDDTFYAGGSYDSLSVLLIVVVTFLPIISALLIAIILRKNKWLPIMLASALAVCFQQGLILFFNDVEQLAPAYMLSGGLLSSGQPIFGLFIPMMFCVQRRKNATAATGMLALYLVMNSATYFTGLGSRSLSSLVTPAVTFTLSIATIAYLFYLYGENNRVYIAGLIEEFRGRDVSEVNESVARTDRLENLGLTPREKEVCALLLKSLTVRQISGELSLAFNTVNGYYRSLYKKLGIGSKAELFLRFGQAENEVESESVSAV
jgi:DNA-binding CsgD family transcriptional regulator